MKKLKIGQIGIGHNHGQGKMLAVRKFPELFEVVGYAEQSEEWVRKRGNLDCYKDLRRFDQNELIEKCDAILVEPDVWDLTKTAQMCIDAGKHIHMDKPASGTLAEFKTLLDSAREKNLTLQLGYMWRYHPGFDLCKKMIKDGTLGEIYQIDAEMSLYHPAEYREWLKNFKGGTMYIFGSHLIDLIVSMLGVPEGVYPFIKQTGFENVCSDDNCFLVMDYKKATARVTSLSVEPDGAHLRRFAVMGSRGVLEIKPIELDMKIVHYTTDAPPREIAIDPVPDERRYDEMMKDFYNCCVLGKQNPYSFEHELAVQKVIYKAIGLE